MSADQSINDLRLRVKRLAGHRSRSEKQDAALRRYLIELTELEYGSAEEFCKSTFEEYRNAHASERRP